MYVFVRLLIACICLVGGILLIRSFCVIHKRKKYAALFFGCFILSAILMFIPMENCLFKFHSPESAFGYYTGTKNVKLVVNGSKSDLVIGDNKGKDILLILPKENNTWKIGTGINTKMVYQTFSNDSVIQLYRYGDTDDYYLQLTSLSREPLIITDSLNSSFYLRTYANGQAEYDNYIYYAYIVKSDQYWLSVNGDIVLLNEGK